MNNSRLEAKILRFRTPADALNEQVTAELRLPVVLEQLADTTEALRTVKRQVWLLGPVVAVGCVGLGVLVGRLLA